MNVTAGAPLQVVIVGSGSVGSAPGANLRSLGDEVRVASRPSRSTGEVGRSFVLVAHHRTPGAAP